MALSVLKEIRKIYAAVNADSIRAEAERELTVGLAASDEDTYRAMEEFLVPAGLPEPVRREALGRVHRLDGKPPAQYDFVLCEPGLPVPQNGYLFDPAAPSHAVAAIVDGNPDAQISLARHFPQFRRAVADKIIYRVARENAFFSLVTALPNVIPSLLDLPWALGEFATDTAFLTMNQVRMALLMAARPQSPDRLWRAKAGNRRDRGWRFWLEGDRQGIGGQDPAGWRVDSKSGRRICRYICSWSWSGKDQPER